MSSNTPTALVTGASYGIGRAIAIELARAGYNLALLARSEADLNETAARVRSHGKQATVLPVDITDDKAIRNMAGRLQKAMPFLNVLINGASASPDSKSFEKLDPSEITNIVDTSVRGTLLVTQALLPFLTAS